MSEHNHPKILRCFYAVTLDKVALQQATGLLQHLEEAFIHEKIRWVKTENLHITLKFLGPTEETLLPLLQEKVKAALQNTKNFALTISDVILFPGKHPHVVAMNIKPQESLIELAQTIDAATQQCGFTANERQYNAHLTLGRIKNKKVLTLPLDLPKTVLNIQVNEIALIQSITKAEGAVYTVLTSHRLGG